MGERRSLMEFLFGELSAAVADARGKLVEEGWFGRRAPDARSDAPSLGWTADKPEPAGDFYMPRASFEEAWARREPAAPGERAPDDKGFDFDR